jgi:hypothetical protein
MEILPKRSSVSGKSPATSNLQTGEIAINIYPGTEGLYTKNSDGAVVKIGGTDTYTLIGSYSDATGICGDIVTNEEVTSEILSRLMEKIEALESQVAGLKERIDYLELGNDEN